jgi:thiol-disulfide isomerase/thioredoxin
MRRSLLAVAPLLLVLSVAAPVAASRRALAPGEQVPYLMGFDIWNGENQVVTWGENDATLINFWATWCEPCRKEMPILQSLHERLQKEGLRIVAVTKDDATYEDLQAFIYSVGVTFPTIRTPEVVSKKWGGMGSLPSTFLVDKNGKLLRRYVGFTETQSEAMVRDVENVLAGKPLGPLPLATDEKQDVVTEDIVP